MGPFPFGQSCDAVPKRKQGLVDVAAFQHHLIGLVVKHPLATSQVNYRKLRLNDLLIPANAYQKLEDGVRARRCLVDIGRTLHPASVALVDQADYFIRMLNLEFPQLWDNCLIAVLQHTQRFIAL